MFSMYKSLVEEISKTMDIKTEEKNDSKDDEIMEFFPE